MLKFALIFFVMPSVRNRISAVCELGRFLANVVNHTEDTSDFHSKLKLASVHNQWFTPDNLEFCLKHWSEILTEDNITDWLGRYKIASQPKKVGIVMAGNLPLVGLHDLIAVLLSGHQAVVKTSSKDEVLMSAVIDFLTEKLPDLKNAIQKTDKLKDLDAVIATGSNNTARYFEYYFRNIPHIIRKNRTGVAVLDGSESEEELKNLSQDVFRYFGLGCRSITRLFLPENYDVKILFNAFYKWKDIIHHSKYANNYEYNRTIYLMNKEDFFDNNFLILKESDAYHAPIGVLHYSFYHHPEILNKELIARQDEIQCIAGRVFTDFDNSVELGQTQKPGLNDYADGVDVMRFLEQL